MDILTHTLSGVAVGSCLALYSKNSWKEKTGILLFSGLGGALPDIDAISLWSKFDGSLGKLFGLAHKGKDIYSAKFWYSHHGFMHSLMAALLFSLVIGLILYFISKLKQRKLLSINKPFYKYRLLLSGFTLGYCIHLLQDMVTPGGSWGGIRLLFPMKTYVGGTGDIWWWNNYDVFLIVTTVLIINLILLAISPLIRKKLWKTGVIIFAVAFITATIQIKTRGFNFNKKPYGVCETKSKAIQKDILGKKLYDKMEKFDESLKIYF